MIKGVGVDILHVPRLARLLAKSERSQASLVRRILSPAERELFQKESRDALRFLSVRWTLKEAAWKATRPADLTWQDVTVVHDQTGAPSLQIPKLEGGNKTTCSVSHDGEYCVAYVVAESNRPLNDKRGTGEMVEEHEREIPRSHDRAHDWIEKW